MCNGRKRCRHVWASQAAATSRLQQHWAGGGADRHAEGRQVAIRAGQRQPGPTTEGRGRQLGWHMTRKRPASQRPREAGSQGRRHASVGRAGRLRGGKSVTIAVGCINFTGKKGHAVQALALRTWQGKAEPGCTGTEGSGALSGPTSRRRKVRGASGQWAQSGSEGCAEGSSPHRGGGPRAGSSPRGLGRGGCQQGGRRASAALPAGRLPPPPSSQAPTPLPLCLLLLP